MPLYQVFSDKSYEEVCSNVENVCKKHGFGVMQVYDFNKILEEKGHPIERQVTVFEICQPQVAAQMLSGHSGDVAVFMPCRIAVEKFRDKTRIFTFLPTKIVHICETPDVYDVAESIDVTIKKILDELK